MKKHLTLLLIALAFANSHAQLQNMDFESWGESPESVNLQPEGWKPFGYAFPVFDGPSTSAQNGSYAVTTNIYYLYWKSTLQQKAAIDYRPAALSGYYTYTHNTDMLDENHNPTIDTARVSIYLTQWNSQMAQHDTIGIGELKLNGAANFTAFSCPIYYSSTAIPDSITIRLDPSRAMGTGWQQNCRCATANDCSYFTVDNLTLEESLGLPAQNKEGLFLYPNPVTDFIEIKSYTGMVIIFDASGRKVQENTVAAGKPIDVTQLQSGIYSVRLKDGQVYRFIRQ
jgi:hypothetical protein